MDRYDMGEVEDKTFVSGHRTEMVPNAYGDWVKFEDVEDVLIKAGLWDAVCRTDDALLRSEAERLALKQKIKELEQRFVDAHRFLLHGSDK